MLKPARTSVLLLLAATAAANLAACKKKDQPPPPAAAPPQLALTPSAAARANLAAEITLASLDRTLNSVGTAAKKLQFPFGPDELRQMLFARGQFAAAAIEKIDQTKPLAVVVIAVAAAKPAGDAGASAGASAGEPAVAFALKDTSKKGFDAFVAALGKVTETQKDAVRVQPGDAGDGATPMWMLSRDGVVVAAEKVETLVAGGVPALEARRELPQDLRITLLPEGIARASGTTLKEFTDKAKAGVAKQQADAQAALAGGGGKDPKLQANAGKIAESVVGWMLDAVADTSEARIGLSVDPAKGLTSTLEAVPRPGSPFARMIAPRKPYAVDPILLAGEPAGALWAMGDLSISRTMWNAVRDPLLELAAPEAERAKINATIDSIFDAASGPTSARFNFGGGPKLDFAYDVVYALKPGTDGKKLLADIESLVKAPWLGKLFDAAFSGMAKVKVGARRDGDALAMQVAFDARKAPPALRAELKNVPFMDGKPIEGRTVVEGDRMIVSTGAGAKARLQALRTATAAPPAGEVATALAETKGDDGLYYVDLAAMFRPLAAMLASGGMKSAGGGGANPAAMGSMAGAMLKDARLAMWGSYKGGESLTMGWRVPMSTFESIAVIVRGAMGMGGPP